MNKLELIDVIVVDVGIIKVVVKLVLEFFLGNVGIILKKGGRILLVGFGFWLVFVRVVRDGRNL